MNQNKTTMNDGDVQAFLNSVEDENTRKDAQIILQMMEEETKLSPKMWGKNMIGFGSYHYKYKSGREGDYFRIGFSPRKQKFSIYLMDGMVSNEAYTREFEKLGKHTKGKSCLYIKKLEQIDQKVLREIIAISFKEMNKLVEETEGWE